MRFSKISLGALLLATATATPALAQDTAPTGPFTIESGVTLTSDYRFRGISQTSEDPAIQASVNIGHESGFYVGAWASSIDGDPVTGALPGYGDAEVDLYAGYSADMGGVGVDVGLLYYWYPAAISGADTDFFEPYATVSATMGPVDLGVGVNYAWDGQDGLGGNDSLYIHGEAGIGIPNTPLTLTGHIGYSDGVLGAFNPNVADDNYLDWSVGVEGSVGPATVGVQYVDTDITNASGFNNFIGADSTVLGYVSFGF